MCNTDLLPKPYAKNLRKIHIKKLKLFARVSVAIQYKYEYDKNAALSDGGKY